MGASDRFLTAIRVSKSRGRTKSELQNAFQYSTSHTAQVVNDLVAAGKIAVSGKRGRSDVFVIASSTPSSSTRTRSTSSMTKTRSTRSK